VGQEHGGHWLGVWARTGMVRSTVGLGQSGTGESARQANNAGASQRRYAHRCGVWASA